MPLTGTGWSVLAAASAVLAVGVALGYPELLLVGGLGDLVVVGAALWVGRPPQLTAAHHASPTRIERGEMVRITVDIVTTRGRAMSRGLEATTRCGDLPLPFRLPRAGAPSMTMPVTPRRRGLLDIGPLHILRADPFGFARFERTFGTSTTLWVLPRTHPIRSLPASVTRDVEGSSADKAPDGTVVFHALREYVPGDDVRHVHWRSSARTDGKLLVRQHVDSSRPDLTIALDNRPSVYQDAAFEEAVDLAASFVRGCIDRGFPVDLRLGADRRRVRGRRALEVYLEELALVSAQDDLTTGALVNALGGGRPSALLVVITGDLPNEEIGAFAGLRRSFRRVVIASVSPSPAVTVSGPLAVITGQDAPAVLVDWERVTRR